MANSPFACRKAQGVQGNTFASIKNYRQSIDMTATAGTIAVDGGKRNELYSMLREEIMGHLRQTDVSKDTILSMKQKLRLKKKELREAGNAYQVQQQEKDGLIETNQHLESDVKDLEA